MALPSRYGIDKNMNSMEGLSAYENGGKGSGNFGHSGRPGEVGGSGDGGGGFSKGDDVTFYQYGENHKGRIIRKISEKEKQDRADLNNPNAGDYYEVEIGSGDFVSKSIVWEGRIKKAEKQSKDKKLAEIRDKNRQKREAEVSKAKAEREEHIKQIDKIIGSEKITEGKTKAEDDKNYKKLEKDVREIKRILAKEKSRENFGQEEIRKLRDKYSDYMSGNWSVTERFQRSMRDFEDWADNYVNNSLENAIADAVTKALNGGAGSGNFGHAGRPGKRGGSGSGIGKYEKRKDYKAEQKGVEVRDGHSIGVEFADLERELGNARTNLKMLKKDKETAYTDSAARSRYLDRSSAIARTIAQATSFGPSSKETKKLVKEMTKELRDIYDEYVEVGTKKYFDPDLNVER